MIPGLSHILFNHQELDAPRKITTAGRYQLAGVGQGLLRGHIIDGEGVQRLILKSRAWLCLAEDKTFYR